jgi:hypothetical protein
MAHECRRDGLPSFGFDLCYGHTKKLALNGSRSSLTAEELEFVGVVSRRQEGSGGWRQPSTLPAHLSPDSAMLQALMSIEAVDLGRDRLRFLG